MSSHLHAVPHVLALTQAAAAAMAFFAAAAQAQESPYYIGVTQSFTHDSRVLRQNAVGSDTISSTGVLGGLNIHLGRQRLYADAKASNNRYSRFKDLEHTSHSLSAGLDWETIERLSGRLGYMDSQELINYGAIDIPITTKSVQKVKQASASVRYGITSRFAVDAGAEDRRVDFSAPEDPRDYTQKVARAGLNWGTPGVLTLGTGVRLTKGDYPSAVISPFVPGQPDAVPPIPDIPAVYGPDKTERKDVYVSVAWTPSGLSTITGRINATRQTHTQPTIPRLSAITGAVHWDYRPSDKLAFKTSLVRDTGSETLFSDIPVGLLPLRPDNEKLGTVLSVDAEYALTAKIATTASVRHRRVSTSQEATTSSNSTNIYSLGATYAATRTISLGCNYTQESRGSAYTVDVTSCFGQFVLR